MGWFYVHTKSLIPITLRQDRNWQVLANSVIDWYPDWNSTKTEIFNFPFHLETLLTVGGGGVDDANCVSHVSDNETRLEKAYSSIISHYTCSYPFNAKVFTNWEQCKQTSIVCFDLIHAHKYWSVILGRFKVIDSSQKYVKIPSRSSIIGKP